MNVSNATRMHIEPAYQPQPGKVEVAHKTQQTVPPPPPENLKGTSSVPVSQTPQPLENYSTIGSLRSARASANDSLKNMIHSTETIISQQQRMMTEVNRLLGLERYEGAYSEK